MIYNIQTGLPKSAEIWFGRKLRLLYSNHAKFACLNDKYGVIYKPPFVIEVTSGNLIEVELINGSIVKLVIRLAYDEKFDVTLAGAMKLN